MNNNEGLGFDMYFQSQVEGSSYIVGRISTSVNGVYKIISSHGEFQGQVSGKFYYQATGTQDFPCVGDWVLWEAMPGENKGIVHKVLDRKSLLSRKVAGTKQEEQMMAANVDTVFLVNALNGDFNLRRMERYLMLAYESGVSPVFVLTKKDLCEDIQQKLDQVESISLGTPVITVDSLNGEGMEDLSSFLIRGKTVSLLGSSGVGKSTLMNRLMGSNIQKTQDVRDGDDRGRHTTTHRELFFLPNGAIIIDTPGMRELQLWGGDSATKQTFQDIQELATQCKFRDCRHDLEPGCAIQHAIEKGIITQDRMKSYRKIERERKFLNLKEKYGSHRASKIQVEEIHKGRW